MSSILLTTYLLNSAVLTSYGEYVYSPIDVAHARELLKEGFVSAVGHAGSAEFCSLLLGIPVSYNRISITMQPGDRAIVVRIKERLPEAKSLTLEEAQAVPYEIGLLARVKPLSD